LTALIFGPRLLPMAMVVMGIPWVVRRPIVTGKEEDFHREISKAQENPKPKQPFTKRAAGP